MSSFTLLVPGEPRGKGRPRFVRKTGRAYTDAETVSAEEKVRGEWRDRGRPRLDGPLAMDVIAVMRRPQSHWSKRGGLTPAGQRNGFPCKTPDADNLLKLAQDALNEHGFGDDCQIVTASVIKAWQEPGQEPHLQIIVRELNGAAA